MDLTESMSDALGNLGKHKMRTSLTMLGMIFGVGAVIAMLSIGAGGERQALETISRLGLHNVIIRAKDVKAEDRQEVRKNSLGVSLRDAEAVVEAVPGVEAVLPRVEIRTYKIAAESGRSDAKVYGLSWRHPEFATIDLDRGRYFDELDERAHGQVCLIGTEVGRDLFGEADPIGELVKVNDVWLEVIGILGSIEHTSPASAETLGGSGAREIYLPVTTAMRKFERDPLEAPVDELVVKVAEEISTQRTGEIMKPLLDRLHGGEDDYEIIVPEALLEQSRRTQRIFNIVMGSIAGISLLVGGIGIMNIMLATVLERTREIGVRRALGARKRDIRVQFVIESFAISVIGGFAGIVVGVLLAKIVAAYAGWPTVIRATSLLLSTGVSMSVGLISGIYPASRAAELDPIDALRYE